MYDMIQRSGLLATSLARVLYSDNLGLELAEVVAEELSNTPGLPTKPTARIGLCANGSIIRLSDFGDYCYTLGICNTYDITSIRLNLSM